MLLFHKKGRRWPFGLGLILLFQLLSSAQAACPDLQSQGLTLFGPQIVAPGEIIGNRLLAFARNLGDTASGPYSVAFYISSDADISTADQLLSGGREFYDSLSVNGIEPLPPCASQTGGCAFISIPGGWPVGPAYIGLLVDEFQVVTECLENNNFEVIEVMVSEPGSSVLQVPGAYATLSEAIRVAAAGDTIHLAAGEYDEEFIIDKDLVFRGDGIDVTILRSSTNDSAIVELEGVSVVFEHLQFKGWPGGPYFVRRGIAATNSKVLVRNCKFIEITNYGIESFDSWILADSVHIFVQGGTADVGLGLHGSIFAIRNSYGGINIDHVFDVNLNSLGVVEYNTVDGKYIDQANGVRLRDNTEAVVRGNILHGQQDTLLTEVLWAGGIAIMGAVYAEVYDNLVHDFTYGLNVSAGAKVKVYQNSFTNSVVTGVRVAGSPPSFIDLGGGVWGSPGLNEIHSNGGLNVRNDFDSSFYARYNHWNQPDSALIDATIYDDDENSARGKVIFMPLVNNTLPGLNFEVAIALGIKLNYEEVTLPGITYIDLEEVGPPLPPQWISVPSDPPRIYNISTTAEYTGNIQITIPYDENDVTGSENDLILYHYSGGLWANITTGLNASANEITGLTNLLSPFVIAEPGGCCGQFAGGQTGNTDCSDDGKRNLADITRLIDRVYVSKAVLCCEANGNVDGDAAQKINLADITRLIDHVYISKVETAGCE